MGEPVIINDGSPVKVWWLGDHGWTPDQEGPALTRAGDLQLRWMVFNGDFLFGRVTVDGPLQMKVNIKLRSENTGVTLLVSTDKNRKNFRLEIADAQGRKFSDFFVPARVLLKGPKLQTKGDASITGISYQIGGGEPRKARTLKKLPTSIYFELAGPKE